MQRAQNNVAWVYLRRCVRARPLLKSLHWLSVQQRIQYKIAVITRKAVDFRSAVHRRTPTTPSDDAVSAVHQRSASLCAVDTH